MSALLIASLTPRWLDIHGDTKNANVLASRAQWAGHDAEIVEVNSASDAAGLRPDAVVIGTGFDSDAAETLRALRSFSDDLHVWAADGTATLAVGLGWELLSQGTHLDADHKLEGIGMFSGHFTPSTRKVAPLVLSSNEGVLVGYGYHYRDYRLGDDEIALGAVLAGVGNVLAEGERPVEGARRASMIGTTMRGPILARNPKLVDALLPDVFVGANKSEDMLRADHLADQVNARVIEDLGLSI